MLKKGGVLVLGDISSKMMQLVKDKFDDLEWSGGYTNIEGNKYSINSELVVPLEDHSIDLEEIIK